MKLFHRSRVVAALIALFSLLFAQLAVAAYACPAQEISKAFEAAGMAQSMQSMTEMQDCSEMDLEQPNLCQALVQAGDQSLDKPSVPDIASFSPELAAVVLYRIAQSEPPLLPRITSSSLANSTAPPIAIRHCCFRI